jgi:hypothetical protein
VKLLLVGLTILCSLLCEIASADITLVAATKAEGESAVGQLSSGKDSDYWVISKLTDDRAEIRLQPFLSTLTNEQKAIPSDFLALVLAQRYSSSSSKQFLIIYLDPIGMWKVSKLDFGISLINTGTAIKSMALATEGVATLAGYAIAGTDLQDSPAIFLLDESLKRQRTIGLPVRRRGEVSSIFVHNGKMFAISNYEDKTGYFHELDFAGTVRSSTLLGGGAATGIALGGGRGFAVTYRTGNDVFVERLDEKLKSQWVTKLHAIQKIATSKGQLLDLESGVAWVGGNNDRLTVHRVSDRGVLVQSSVDTLTGFGIPT